MICSVFLFTHLNSNLDGMTVIQDETGKIIGYKTNKGGADTVFPFKSSVEVILKFYCSKNIPICV